MPMTDDIIFSSPYCNQGNGLEQAIHEELARALWVYHEEIPEGSPFHLGRHNENGIPLIRTNRSGMTWCTALLEQLECPIKILDKLVVDFMWENNTLYIMRNAMMVENRMLKGEKQKS